MKYRYFPNTDIRVSEVGFGTWTVSTGWWGEKTDAEAVAMLRRAHDELVRRRLPQLQRRARLRGGISGDGDVELDVRRGRSGGRAVAEDVAAALGLLEPRLADARGHLDARGRHIGATEIVNVYPFRELTFAIPATP